MPQVVVQHFKLVDGFRGWGLGFGKAAIAPTRPETVFHELHITLYVNITSSNAHSTNNPRYCYTRVQEHVFSVDIGLEAVPLQVLCGYRILGGPGHLVSGL